MKYPYIDVRFGHEIVIHKDVCVSRQENKVAFIFRAALCVCSFNHLERKWGRNVAYLQERAFFLLRHDDPLQIGFEFHLGDRDLV